MNIGNSILVAVDFIGACNLVQKLSICSLDIPSVTRIHITRCAHGRADRAQAISFGICISTVRVRNLLIKTSLSADKKQDIYDLDRAQCERTRAGLRVSGWRVFPARASQEVLRALPTFRRRERTTTFTMVADTCAGAACVHADFVADPVHHCETQRDGYSCSLGQYDFPARRIDQGDPRK